MEYLDCAPMLDPSGTGRLFSFYFPLACEGKNLHFLIWIRLFQILQMSYVKLKRLESPKLKEKEERNEPFSYLRMRALPWRITCKIERPKDSKRDPSLIFKREENITNYKQRPSLPSFNQLDPRADRSMA